MADTTVKVLDPQTGKVEDLPGDAAQTEWLAGRRQLVKGAPVPLIGPDGRTVMDADADRVPDALAAGWKFATPKQVLVHDAEGQQLRAFSEAAGAELTLGLSDVIARSAGAEGLAERRETAAGNIGTAVGVGAGFLVPGLGEIGAAGKLGRGVAREALGAALLPMAAVDAAGQAVERTASQALTRYIESEAARKVVGSTLGRAVEGAVYGAGAGLSEEALGNPEMNAQSLLAAVGGGALLGAGFGGALGGGMRAFGEGAARAGEALGNRAKRYTPTAAELSDGLAQMGVDVDPGNPILNRFTRLLKEDLPAAIGGYDVEDIRKVNTPKAQAWLKDGKDVIEDSGRALRGVVDAMTAEQKDLGRQAYGGLRTSALDRLMPQGSEGLTLRQAADTFDTVRSKLLAIEENEGALGLKPGEARRMVGGYLNALDDAEARIFKKAGVTRQYEERTVVQDPLYDREALLAQRRAEQGTYVPAETRAASPKDRVARAGQEIPLGPRWDADVQEAAGVSREEFDQIMVELKKEGWNARTAPRADLPADQTRPGRFFASDNPNIGADLPLSRSRTGVEQRTRRLQDLAENYQLPNTVVREAFDRLNKLKGLLDEPAKFGDEISGAADREIQGVFQDAYQTVRNHLEDETVWGEAGRLQKELNTAYAQRARAWEGLKKAIKFNGDEIDPAAIQSYLTKVDRLKGDRVTELLDDWQKANLNFAQVADTKFRAGGDILARAQKLDREFSSVRNTIGEKVGVFNALTRLQQRRNQVFSFSGGGVVNSILGGALGSVFGLPAAAAGLAAQSIIDPGRTALLRANTAGTVRRVQDYVQGRAEQLFSGARKALPTPLQVEQQVSRATLRMLNAKTPKERLEAYNERLAEVQALSDPYQYGNHSAQALGQFADALPAHAQAMNDTAAIALGMLGASLPRVRQGSVGPGPFDLMDREPQPHDRDVLKWAQVDHILQQPLSVFDKIEKGYLFQHEVEALNKAYPGLAEQIRAATIAAAGTKKRRLSHNQNRALGQLFGSPAAAYRKIAYYQSSFQPAGGQAAPGNTPQPQSAAPKKPSVRTRELQSTTDRLDEYP